MQEKSLQRLLRGVSTNHTPTIRDAWRALLVQDGAAEAVQRTLASLSWSDNSRGPAARYFGVLLALWAELDTEMFRAEVARLRRVKLHPYHRRTLDLMARRADAPPAAFLGDRLPLFIASEFSDRSGIAATITNWSTTPNLSLDQITRIDVIAPAP